MLVPYFRNGGMIGTTLDFNSEETYGGGGGSGTTLTYLNNYAQEGSNQNPVTFSNVDFGTAASDRYIIVGYSTRNDSRTINSVTIGGVSATILVQQGNGNTTTGMAMAAVPTGTSGNVVVTLSGTADAHYLGVWAATGLASATPVATATSVSSGSDAGAQSFTMNTDANGFVIVVDGSAAGGNGPENPATVSSNLTLRYDGVGTTPLHTTGSSAGADGLTDGTQTTFEITIGDVNNNNPAVAATFEGTAGGPPANKKNSGIWDILSVFDSIITVATNVNPNAVDWNNIITGGSNATTNTQTISGINTTITLQATFTQDNDSYTLQAVVNGSPVGSPVSSPGNFTFDVSNNDTVAFQASGGDTRDATATITNVSDNNTVLDTFGVTLND